MFFFDIKSIFLDYENFQEKHISNSSKLFRYNEMTKVIEKYKSCFQITTLGVSTDNRKIFKIQWGKGKKKVFIWSQMHGNETTGTKSMFDILNFILNNRNHDIVCLMKNKITIIFIPMLNPDGSEFFKRRNAVNIDLNRDLIYMKSMEIRLLLKELNKEQPFISFNLHDQRSIYNVGDKFFNPSILSFLSPSIDNKKTNSITRMMSMGMINKIVNEIRKILPDKGSISRYSDKYYPFATGDYLQKLGYPCILFEAGNYPGDINKRIIRKYNAISIFLGLYFTSSIEEHEIKHNYKNYFYIKKNKNILLDKIYRNVKIQKNNNSFLVDIGLMKIDTFNIKKMNLDSKFEIVDIGDLSSFFSYNEIFSKGKMFYNKKDKKNYPTIGETECFDII
ncbi:M14 family zinc carboxypeptidase [Blattabacterium cuenoti]|uniref:M14 family zinc carboxypeptidase n=1 Tax=Blattabacterium cuenoti TaxID=1653831 RepID=UPI00163BFD74|nr:M14 family zinc carboxypeptidase [Blattabacterium cuenoti]